MVARLAWCSTPPLPRTLDKLRRLRAMCVEHGVDPLIEIDGGVGAGNAEELGAAGATVLVAGSAVFGAEDPAQAVEDIRQAGTRGRASREA